MIRGSVQQEDITIVNTYASNLGAHKYIKQILIGKKGETESNIIIDDFKTPLASLILTENP